MRAKLNQNLLLMGPVSPPYTGQSVAFTTILKYYMRSIGFRIKLINLSNKNNIISGIFLSFNIILKLIFNRFNIIYFTCSRSFLGSLRDVILLLLARLFNIKVVNHLHGADFADFYKNTFCIYQKILKFAYMQIDTSIVLLDGMKKEFIDFPNMYICVVPNSYSVELDHYPLTINQSNNEMQCVYLSNIMASKGILNLLQAFEILLASNNKIKLIIAGDFIGDYLLSKNEVKARFYTIYNQIKRKYSSSIDYIGIVSGKAKYDLLWNSDIFILPTFHKTEAFPISMLEALRAGNYVISTKHNFIPDIISKDNGDLIEPNSVEALVISLQNIIIDQDKIARVKNFNIEYAIKYFQEQKYIDKVTGIINETLNHHSKL